MQIRLPRLALSALSMAATDSFAQTTAASASTDYSNPQAWLCRPDRPGACNVDLSTTVLDREGRSTVERARPPYGWVLSLMFASWALGTWALGFVIWSQVTTRDGRIGVVLLIVSGFGGAMASIFEINHPLHDIAGTIGLLGPIAVMIVSVSLSRTEAWSPARTALLWTANLNWMSIVLLFFAALGAMMVTYKQAAGDMTAPPRVLPPGVIGLVGYANRLSVVVNWVWMVAVAWYAIRLSGTVRRTPHLL